MKTRTDCRYGADQTQKVYGEVPAIAEEPISDEDKNRIADLEEFKPNENEELDEKLKRSIQILHCEL